MSMEKVGDGAVVEHSSLPREDYIYIAGGVYKIYKWNWILQGGTDPSHTPSPPPRPLDPRTVDIVESKLYEQKYYIVRSRCVL